MRGHALELALDQAHVEVEERQAFRLAPERRLEDAPQRRLGDRHDPRGRPPRWQTETGRPLSAIATSVESTPPKPTLKAFSTTTTRRAPPSAPRTAVDRERAERGDPEYADPDPRVTQVVDDVLDRPEHRAHGDDDHVGVGAPVGVHETARVAPEGLGELRTQLGDAVERGQLPGVGQVPDLLERLGPDHGTDGIGLGGVEHLARLVRAGGRRPPAPGWAGRPARWRG